MQYTMYYEEQQKITLDQYGQMKQALMLREPKQKFEAYTLRKLKFCGTQDNDAIPQYYLCVKNQEEDQIYLEKKYIQNHIWHRACAKMSRKECEQVLRGDIQWMSDHKEMLFQDFYLQATLNHLSPGNVIEYQREMIRCRSGYVTFMKKISCVVGGRGNLLWPDPMMIRCLDEDKVMMTYKKKVNLPNTIREMMQGRETASEETAFVF